MAETRVKTYRNADRMVAEILERTGKTIRLALPLGIGKPVTLVNALTRAACRDPDIELSIFTALTLERPQPSGELEEQFFAPALDRLFGAYPDLDYVTMLRAGTLPDNITVNEFFLMAGRWLGVDPVQQAYVPANYTHALDVLVARRPNLVLQLLAQQGEQFSLSGNTDITVDLLALRRRGEMSFLMAGETNADLPFMGGAAEIGEEEVDMVLDSPDGGFELFSAIRRPVSLREHATGLHVSRMIADGGTLQIGIGQLGDALANALLLRERGGVAPIWANCPFDCAGFHEEGRFQIGLYAVSEMLVDGLLRLFDAGVVRREVDGASIHAGFFVESRNFYAALREMSPERRAKIAMMPVSFTNALYGQEAAKRAARIKARFVNSAMKVSLLGDVMSDALADGQVVSGVGGQFNFVEQAFALENARAIITIPATRAGRCGVESNILWEVPVTTIPRHLRDIIVTEYGIADLRGQPDSVAIARLIAIADSRFQEVLISKAQKAGKLPSTFRLDARYRANFPETIANWLSPHDAALARFPFGTDFSAVEQNLLPALTRIKNAARREPAWRKYVALASLLRRGFGARQDAQIGAAMRRMGYCPTPNLREPLQARLLRGALHSDNGP